MKIINLTPHAITIPNLPVSGMDYELHDWTLAPSGKIARAVEEISPAPSIGDIPTSYVSFSGVVDIPEPEWLQLPSPCDTVAPELRDLPTCVACGGMGGHHPPGRMPAVYYVVSSIAADAAKRSGRSTEDLLVPGQQVRDAAGRVVGCQSLARVR